MWLKQDFQCRKVHSVELLQKIRLGVIPTDLLFDIIMKELPDLLSMSECYRMVERIFAGDKKDLQQMYTTRTTITVGFGDIHLVCYNYVNSIKKTPLLWLI